VKGCKTTVLGLGMWGSNRRRACALQGAGSGTPQCSARTGAKQAGQQGKSKEMSDASNNRGQNCAERLLAGAETIRPFYKVDFVS
jgi:hypothetical protein